MKLPYDDILQTALNTGDWEIQTPQGWKSFDGIIKLKKKQLYTVVTENGESVKCTSTHAFIGENGERIFCKNSLNRNISTKSGFSKVISINKFKKDFVYDIKNVKDTHTYFANNILQHNTHLLEEFWKSVIPIVSSGKKTKIFMVSTPNGVGNKFYEIYSEAEKNANGWTAERIDWWDVPDRTDKWKKQMISALGSEESFQQEFGNQFTDINNSAIGASVIERFKEQHKKPIWTGEEGCYQVFEEPSPQSLYVIGVDVGEGIGRAFSVAQVLDVTDLTDIKQVAVYSTNVVEPYHFANKLNFLCNQWGKPPLLIERNNCGGQVIDTMFHKHMYEKIVSCSKLSSTGSMSNTRHLGVLSHNNMRFASVANMRYWMNTLQVVSINDMDTIKELETFIRYPNGTYRKKNDTYTDDKVMATVWALFILESEICQQYFEIAEHDTQEKPLKILSNGYDTKDPNLYIVGHLVENHIADPNNTFTESKHERLITPEELSKIEVQADQDMEELLSLGYVPLQ
jgi:hypothetical protein